MSRLLDNAAQLLETAEAALRAGQRPSEMTMFIGPSGLLRITPNAEGGLETLASEQDMTVLRVSRADGKVRVEGRAGQRTCLLEIPDPQEAARVVSFAAMPLDTEPMIELEDVAEVPEPRWVAEHYAHHVEADPLPADLRASAVFRRRP